MRVTLVFGVLLVSGCGGETEQLPPLLGNEDWSVGRAFHLKAPDGRFGFQLMNEGCYGRSTRRGIAEVDGPRTWIITVESENDELGNFPIEDPRGLLPFARTEQEMNAAMAALGSPGVQHGRPEFFMRIYRNVRFDWNEDGLWDASYSWVDWEVDQADAILRALSPWPLVWRLCEH